MLTHLRPALVMLGLMVGLTGLAYPLAMTSFAQAVFPAQSNANLIERDGQIIGSALVAQGFTAEHYFHPRPSAADFDATDSDASNFGPTNAELIAQVAARADAFRADHEVTVVPIDAVTASGSGLDPHISLQNARMQAGRVAAARGVEPRAVLDLVNAQAEAPWLGLFGTDRVNVLLLNLSLDEALPLPADDTDGPTG